MADLHDGGHGHLRMLRQDALRLHLPHHRNAITHLMKSITRHKHIISVFFWRTFCRTGEVRFRVVPGQLRSIVQGSAKEGEGEQGAVNE